LQYERAVKLRASARSSLPYSKLTGSTPGAYVRRFCQALTPRFKASSARGKTAYTVKQRAKTMNDLQTPCAGSASRADSVDAILSRRSTTESYEERCQYALDLVCVYLQEENAQRLEQCLRLCAFDAVWEAPLRNVSYDGLSAISANYQKFFRNVRDLRFALIEQFATPERVFVDSCVSFTMTGDAFDKSPLPVGAHARVRRLNTFHIADGLIRRVTGYEIWEQDAA
jgi:hypothetical protein